MGRDLNPETLRSASGSAQAAGTATDHLARVPHPNPSRGTR